MSPAIDGAQPDDGLINHAAVTMNGGLAVQIYRGIDDLAAVLQRVWRRIGPASAQLQARGSAAPDGFSARRTLRGRSPALNGSAQDRVVQMPEGMAGGLFGPLPGVVTLLRNYRSEAMLRLFDLGARVGEAVKDTAVRKIVEAGVRGNAWVRCRQLEVRATKDGGIGRVGQRKGQILACEGTLSAEQMTERRGRFRRRVWRGGVREMRRDRPAGISAAL